MFRRYMSTLPLTMSLALFAQQTPTSRPATHGPQAEPSQLQIDPHPSDDLVSLNSLITASPLIVEGQILTVLPAIQLRSNVPASIETHVLLSVNRVLKGTILEGRKTIEITQRGGTIGGNRLVETGIPLFEEG